MGGSAIGGALDAARAGTSALRGAKDGAARSSLQAEVEAFDVEQRMAIDMARRDGLPIPAIQSHEEIAALIRDDYAGQSGRAVLGGSIALGLQGSIAALGAHQLHARLD